MKLVNNQPLKNRRWWPVLLIALMMLTLGLTTLDTRQASAACPIQGCEVPEPTPTPTPQPALKNAIFEQAWLSEYGMFRINTVTMKYPTVNSQGQKVYSTRTAHPSYSSNPTTPDYVYTWENTAYFKQVRIDTSRPTYFTVYGQYDNGLYGTRYTTIQYMAANGIYCHRWLKPSFDPAGSLMSMSDAYC